jgi:hypothetical protein
MCGVVHSVKSWVQTHVGVLYAAMALSLVFIIALACCPGVTRTVPLNYIVL